MAAKPLMFISLFSGIGGFDLGFERAGMRCAAQVEWNAKASAVLASHYPNVQRFGDVCDVGKHNLPAADLICGGFPCQDVSVAGKRAGLAGERSGLWFEFLRVLTEVTPRYVVIENVSGLLSSNKGRDFATILQGLVERGYRVAWRVLDAQYFGVPQRRRRVFIVGYLGDGRAAEILFEREGCVWNSPPRREAGEDTAATVSASPPGRRNGGSDPTAGHFVAGTLGAEHGRNRGLGNENEVDMLVFDRQRSDEYGNATVVSTVASRDYKSASDLVVSSVDVRNLELNPDISGMLQAKENGGYSLNYTNPIAYNITFCDANGRRKDRPNGGLYVNETELANTLTEAGQNAQTAIAFTQNQREEVRELGDVAGAIAAEPGAHQQNYVAWGIGSKASSADAIVSNQSHASGGPAGMGISEQLSHSLKAERVGQVATPYAVRRLTPTECERLQGFPDGWTAGQSDSERYRQLGNAVAVPVVEWLGQRIVAQEQSDGTN